MMTINEAIQHCEEVAQENEKQFNSCPMKYDGAYVNNGETACKCAKEHRQLAEWLKDYKRLLEQEPFMNKPCVAHQICHEDKIKMIDEIRAEILDICCDQYCENPLTASAVREMVLEIIDEYKAESEDN